jgi:hypothetical protein
MASLHKIAHTFLQETVVVGFMDLHLVQSQSPYHCPPKPHSPMVPELMYCSGICIRLHIYILARNGGSRVDGFAPVASILGVQREKADGRR